ncbi:hypothetical protein J7K41_02445, partial [Candidatus Micrarchaeota archaeon]|nr:hypothetical protein [Candidatus Micrarchaeota archaeon]
AVMQGIPIPEAADKNRDLKEALDRFGYTDPSDVKKTLRFEKENVELMEHLVRSEGINALRMITEKYVF